MKRTVLGLQAAVLVLLLAGCAPQIVLLVTLTSPNAAIYTNGSIPIQVAVDGGVPSDVSLLLDGAVLVDLVAPYSFVWDTTGAAEAAYQLTARATLDGRSFDSDAVEVTVDRSPPTVVSRTPAPGAEHVWLGQPIQVTFSEMLAPVTVTDTTVEVLDAGSVSLAKTLDLEPSGDAVTMTLQAAPTLPNTLLGALSASITDLAGNPLALPAGPWSWSAGEFRLVEGALNGFASSAGVSLPSLAIRSDGHPVVAWPESDGTVMRVFVYRWDGSAWVQLGGPVGDSPSGTFIFVASLKLDSADNPVVAWDELTTGTSGAVQVSRWDGNSWQSVGDPVSGPMASYLPSLVLDGNDLPIVSYVDFDGVNLNVQVSRWDGGAWVTLGGPIEASAGNTNTTKPSLAFDGSDPVVAWSESDGAEQHVYVRRWNGATWQALGGIIDAVLNENASLPSLAVEQDGTPVVAFREDTATDPKIFAFRWAGAAWVQLGTGFDAGAGNIASNASLALDASDRPVAAWYEFGTSPSDIFLAEFESGSWQLLPAIASALPGTTYCCFNPRRRPGRRRRHLDRLDRRGHLVQHLRSGTQHPPLAFGLQLPN